VGIVTLALAFATAFLGLRHSDDPEHYWYPCWLEVLPFIGYELYLCLEIIDAPEIDAVSAVRFKMVDWVGDPGWPIGITHFNYYVTGGQATGDPETDVTVIFDEPRIPDPWDGGIIPLIHIEFMSFDENWPGANWSVGVAPGDFSEEIIIWDGDGEAHAVESSYFYFKPDVMYPPCRTDTPAYESSWGTVKALY